MPTWGTAPGIPQDIANTYKTAFDLLQPDQQKYMDFMQWVNREQQAPITAQQNLANQQYLDQMWRAQQYYGDLGAYTAKRSAEEQALAQATWTRAWATPSQSNATLANIQNQQLEQMTKIKWDELQRMQDMYNQYQTMLTQFQERYAGNTDKNIVATYKELLNTVNSLKTNMIEATRQRQESDRARKASATATPQLPSYAETDKWIVIPSNVAQAIQKWASNIWQWVANNTLLWQLWNAWKTIVNTTQANRRLDPRAK